MSAMNGPAVAQPSNSKITDALTLSLRDQDVGFFLPARAVLHNARLELPHGALISGTFVGDLICEGGSVVVTEEGQVCGHIEANKVYIAGKIASTRERRSLVTGRTMIAAGSTARINADLRSAAFAIHRPKLWGKLISIEDGQAKIE